MTDLDAPERRLADALRVSRFMESVRSHGVVAGHPRTLAALLAHAEWGPLFAGVRLVASPWYERGELVTGAGIEGVAA